MLVKQKRCVQLTFHLVIYRGEVCEHEKYLTLQFFFLIHFWETFGFAKYSDKCKLLVLIYLTFINWREKFAADLLASDNLS